MNDKFEISLVGLVIKNNQYQLDESSLSEPNAGLIIKGNKMFTLLQALKIVKDVNKYMPNLSTGEFKTKVDGIKFNCNLVRA